MKVAGFIVDKRKSFLIVFLMLCLFCLYAIPKVGINYDLTRYLPADSVTKKALDVAEEEFGLNSIANVIVEKVTPDQAQSLAEELSRIDGVLAAQFDENSSDYYKDGHALIQITLNDGDYSEITHQAIKNIEKALAGYETEMYGSGVHAIRQMEDVNQQMILILAVSIPIIFMILFLNANSYAEIIVFGLVAGVSVLLNKGTNIFLGDISFVTNSIAIVLQLALAMDYSIILLHRFEEEKVNHPEKEAIARALKNSFSSISASSLTTIVGLVAIMFMKYTIGFDIGMVLAKSILCSMLTVFFFMPGVLLMFSKWIERTKHKTLIPNLKFIPKFVIKTRLFMPAILILVIALAFSAQSHNAYSFRFETEVRNHADLFGESNTLIIIVPKGDDAKEQSIIDLMEQKAFVNSTRGISTLGLRDSLTPGQFALRTGLDLKTATGIYAYYIQNAGQALETIPFDQLLGFMLDNHDDLDLSAEEYTNLLKITNLWANRDLLLSASYIGRIFNLPSEKSTQVFAIYEMNQNSKSYPLDTLVDYMVNSGEQSGLSPAEMATVGGIYNIIGLKDSRMTYQEASLPSGLSEDEAFMAYVMYEMSHGDHAFGSGDLIHFINNNISDYSLDLNQQQMLTHALTLIQNKNSLLDAEDFGQLMSINDAASIYDQYHGASGTDETERELIDIINFMFENESALPLTDEEELRLELAHELLNNLQVNAGQFSSLTGLTQEMVYDIYARFSVAEGYRPETEKLADVLNFLNQHSLRLDLTENEMNHIQFLTGIMNNINTSFNSGQLATLLNIEPIKASTILASYGLANGYHLKPHDLLSVLSFLEEYGDDLGLDEEQTTMVDELNRVLNNYQKEMSPDEFAGMVDTTREKAMLLYGLYTVSKTSPGFIFSDVILFLAENYALLGMDISQAEVLLSTKATIEKAFGTFESDEYARLVFNLNLETDDPDAVGLVSDLRKDLKQYYDEYYLLGDSANILDVQTAFDRDVIYVNTITIILILIILIFTFRSVVVPVLLVLIIQGSIWINFSFSTLSDASIIFLGYIIITAIQMGATIDYAIIITGRYQESRKDCDKYQAVSDAIRVSIPTLLTSGGILIVSGFCVGFVSTASSISNLGILIGRGGFISLIMVTFFLPQLLWICDKVVYRKKNYS